MSILKNFQVKQEHINLHKAIQNRGIGRICNDLNPEELQLLTKDQWVELCLAHHKWNGDLEEFDPNRPIMMDFMVTGFLEAVFYEQSSVYYENRQTIQQLESALRDMGNCKSYFDMRKAKETHKEILDTINNQLNDTK